MGEKGPFKKSILFPHGSNKPIGNEKFKHTVYKSTQNTKYCSTMEPTDEQLNTNY